MNDLPEIPKLEPVAENTALSTAPELRVVGLSGLGGTDDMKKKLEENIRRREVVYSLIDEHFIQGIDYGPADNRNPKDTLLKPGAEKICGWFNTHPEWSIDKEMWEILGNPKNTVCMICKIVDNQSGFVIGEGRGAETVGNKQRDVNKTIKNAEKCSLVDVALYTFSLSERFTQDKVGVQNLITAKKDLKERVADLRAGCESELSDTQFIVKICERELHKKSISTKTELDKVYSAIENYDYATGERLPDSILN